MIVRMSRKTAVTASDTEENSVVSRMRTEEERPRFVDSGSSVPTYEGLRVRSERESFLARGR